MNRPLVSGYRGSTVVPGSGASAKRNIGFLPSGRRCRNAPSLYRGKTSCEKHGNPLAIGCEPWQAGSTMTSKSPADLHTPSPPKINATQVRYLVVALATSASFLLY